MSKITFNKLLNIQLLHEYYADNICKDFIIQPTPTTLQTLQNYKLLFKGTSNGIIILYEATDDIGTPKFPIDENIKLSFKFQLQNALFPNFTAVDYSPESSSVYYFNNLGGTVVGQDHTVVDNTISEPLVFTGNLLKLTKADPTAAYVILSDIDGNTKRTDFEPQFDEIKIDLKSYHSGTFSIQQFSSSDAPLGTSFTFYYNPELQGEMPYGIFEVFLDNSYDSTAPSTFIFNFKSRETFWRYNILKNEANPPAAVDEVIAANLSVQHEPDNPGDTINFENATGSDPIIINSADQIKFKENGFDKIRLYKNSNILLSNLPNPSAEKLDFGGGAWVSDIYVYVYV